MSDAYRNGDAEDALDRALASLPREAPAGEALWSGIAAELHATPLHDAATGRIARPLAVHGRRAVSRRQWLSLAAAVVLVVTASLTTYLVMQRSMRDAIAQARRSATQTTMQQMQPVLSAMPVSFGAAHAMGDDYVRARAQLLAEFDRRAAALSPLTRAKVVRDLVQLRRAANEVAHTLEQYPNDQLLQQLLLSAYQDELTLLGDVNELATPATAGAEL